MARLMAGDGEEHDAQLVIMGSPTRNPAPMEYTVGLGGRNLLRSDEIRSYRQ